MGRLREDYGPPEFRENFVKFRSNSAGGEDYGKTTGRLREDYGPIEFRQNSVKIP